MDRRQCAIYVFIIGTSIIVTPSWGSDTALKAEILCPDEGNRTIKLGYLASFGETRQTVERIGRVISGALILAIDTINNDTSLLPDHQLTFQFEDTHGNEDDALRGVTKLWKEGVDGFIGPDITCTIEARLADVWNLPMITYVSREKLLLQTIDICEGNKILSVNELSITS